MRLIPRSFTKTRRRKALTGATSFFLVAAVAALAAWLISGQGDGRGKVGTLQALTVVAGPEFANGDGACYPGRTCDASVTVTNPNSALKVVGASPGNGTVSINEAACHPTNITVETVTGLDIPLPPGESQIILPDAYRLAPDAPNTCQGLNFFANLVVNASTP